MGDGILPTPNGTPLGAYAGYGAALVCIEASARLSVLLAGNKNADDQTSPGDTRHITDPAVHLSRRPKPSDYAILISKRC